MDCSPYARRLTSAAVAVACITGVVVGGELSTVALVAVGLTGAVVAAVGVARHSGEAACPVGRRGLPWLGWLAAVLGWELVTLAADALPTVSDLADPLLASPAVRGSATLGWLAVGAWLVARPRRRTESS
ncbi:hypothetical protein [Blastococcus capsensis]|uniref:hypothetical protein n=1 Tax=Blastococcus capsensis TaxID=1564163 RepID=UPI00253FAADD|nr:hypothetical protein [Blastococcus capsensis]MDK3256945.1 hypothetical protein [Blastococcus capsensis]